MLRHFAIKTIVLLVSIIWVCSTGCTNTLVPIRGNYPNQFSQIVNSSSDNAPLICVFNFLYKHYIYYQLANDCLFLLSCK